MIFLSYWFIIFACICLPAYCLIPSPKARMVILLVSCAVFHTHFAGPAGVLPIIVLASITYVIGLTKNPKLCAWGIALCVLSLVFYKYTRFICESVIGMISLPAGTGCLQFVQPILPGMPPLAVSFFTFEFVHYLFEIRHGGEPIRRPLEFGLFAIFWPSIVSGPIKRYQQFIPSLQQAVKGVNQSDVAVGLVRVAWGIAQKFLADNCALFCTALSSGLQIYDMPVRYIFLAALAARIYFDFAGYSDIAIGYARIMGITLPENFNWPYRACNMVDFWQRWHMSLSSWIRDYVYIPMGGGTHGKWRRGLNVLIAFGLCGLWHGAAWNFALWGIYHGLGVVIATNYQSLPFGKNWQKALSDNSSLRKIWTFFSWFVTLFYVCFGWLLFFYPLEKALHLARLLFMER